VAALPRAPVLGIGTGGFSTTSIEAYPHNLILETAAELGLVGLALLALVLVGGAVTVFGNLASPDDRPRAALILALFAAALVNALLSGDITANAPLWLALGLGLGCAAEARARGPAPDVPGRVSGRRLAAVR
jgi:O-antigen ligase